MNIQLDDFSMTLARFLERIEIEGAEERKWIMMAIVNIGAMLDESFLLRVMRHLAPCDAPSLLCAVSCTRFLVAPVLSCPFSRTRSLLSHPFNLTKQPSQCTLTLFWQL